MPPNDMSPEAVSTPTLKFDAGAGFALATQRAIAAEIPVSFVYGDAPYAVMMASPGDAEDFAYGFSLTEGLVRAAEEIRSVKVKPQAKGLSLEIELAPGRFREHLARRRAMTGRTSCGLCGVETVEQLPQAERLAPGTPVAARAIFAALANLEKNQPLNALTRAVHAAAFCSRDGAIVCVREDVGRHNALGQADRVAPAQGRLASRRLHPRHQPRLVRNGGKGGDRRRDHAGRHFGADRTRR